MQRQSSPQLERLITEARLHAGCDKLAQIRWFQEVLVPALPALFDVKAVAERAGWSYRLLAEEASSELEQLRQFQKALVAMANRVATQVSNAGGLDPSLPFPFLEHLDEIEETTSSDFGMAQLRVSRGLGPQAAAQELRSLAKRVEGPGIVTPGEFFMPWPPQGGMIDPLYMLAAVRSERLSTVVQRFRGQAIDYKEHLRPGDSIPNLILIRLHVLLDVIEEIVWCCSSRLISDLRRTSIAPLASTPTRAWPKTDKLWQDYRSLVNLLATEPRAKGLVGLSVLFKAYILFAGGSPPTGAADLLASEEMVEWYRGRWREDLSTILLSAAEGLQALSAERPQTDTKEQPWDDNATDYLSLSDAISRLADGGIALKKLGKMMKPNGPMHYMRRGRRCKVHIGDFIAWWKQRPKGDAEAERILEIYEDRKAATRAGGPRPDK